MNYCFFSTNSRMSREKDEVATRWCFADDWQWLKISNCPLQCSILKTVEHAHMCFQPMPHPSRKLLNSWVGILKQIQSYTSQNFFQRLLLHCVSVNSNSSGAFPTTIPVSYNSCAYRFKLWNFSYKSARSFDMTHNGCVKETVFRVVKWKFYSKRVKILLYLIRWGMPIVWYILNVLNRVPIYSYPDRGLLAP